MGKQYDKRLIFGVIITALFVLLILYLTRGDDVKNEPALQMVRRNFAKLDPSYKKIPLYTDNRAYATNKSSITLCVRNPETGKQYDDNTLMYVALHELAHVITPSTEDHGKDFQENFAKLLKLAAKKKIFNPYKPISESYCGV